MDVQGELPSAKQLPLMVEARPVRIAGITVAALRDPETARLAQLVLRLTVAQALLQTVFAAWYVADDMETLSVALTGLFWSLMLPACGFVGVQNRDPLMLSCFFAFSLIYGISASIWCLYYLLDLYASDQWFFLFKLLIELLVAIIMCAAGFFGHELASRDSWIEERNFHQSSREAGLPFDMIISQPQTEELGDEANYSAPDLDAAPAAEAFVETELAHVSIENPPALASSSVGPDCDFEEKDSDSDAEGNSARQGEGGLTLV